MCTEKTTTTNEWTATALSIFAHDANAELEKLAVKDHSDAILAFLAEYKRRKLGLIAECVETEEKLKQKIEDNVYVIDMLKSSIEQLTEIANQVVNEKGNE